MPECKAPKHFSFIDKWGLWVSFHVCMFLLLTVNQWLMCVKSKRCLLFFSLFTHEYYIHRRLKKSRDKPKFLCVDHSLCSMSTFLVTNSVFKINQVCINILLDTIDGSFPPDSHIKLTINGFSLGEPLGIWIFRPIEPKWVITIGVGLVHNKELWLLV